MKTIRFQAIPFALAICLIAGGCSHPKGDLAVKASAEASQALRDKHTLAIAVVPLSATGSVSACSPAGPTDESTRSVAELIAESVAERLAMADGIRVVPLPPEAMEILANNEMLTETQVADRLADLVDADAIALGTLKRYLCVKDDRGVKETRLAYELRILDVASGRVLGVASASLEAEGGYIPQELARELARRLVAELTAVMTAS